MQTKIAELSKIGETIEAPSSMVHVQRDVYTRHQQLFPCVTKFLKNYFCDFRVINLIHEHKYDMLNLKEDGDDYAKAHSEKA